MAILKDEEEQQGQGISQSLGQGMAAQPDQQQAVQQQPSQEPTTLSSSAPGMLGETARTPQAQKPQQKQQRAGTGTFTNIRSYLQAAQGGGQQKVAQAAQQQVQRLGTGAQKGLTQAEEAFRERMGAGSGAVFQGEQSQYLDAAEAARRAKKSTEEILGAARGVTYQAPQPTQLTPEQIAAQNQERADLENRVGKRGINPPDFDFWKDKIRQPDGRITYKDGTPFTPGNLDKLSEMTEVATPALTPPPAQTQQYFTPKQQQRFADIINAQYQGPESLQQAGLYEQAAQKARTAQQSAELTQSATGREQLLKDIFGRTRDYGRGASRLDALLLNTSQEGVRQLQEQAQPALQAQQALQEAQNISLNEAAQRRQAIENIRSGARTAFTEARTEEERATEQRIDDLIKTPVLDDQGQPMLKADGTPMTEWDRLPEYFRNLLTSKAQRTSDIQKEMVSSLQEQYKQPIQQQQQLSNQKRALEKELNDLSFSETMAGFSASGFGLGPALPVDRDKMRADAARKEQVEKQLQTVNSQLQAVTNSQDYKDYQKALADAQRINKNQLILSPEEAAVLGISAGEGLYNIRPEDIQTAQAERARLITKDELARQLALSQLAEQDLARELQKDLLYTDMEKAGTQDLLSSLDVEGFRRLLDEAQQGFQTAAERANLTGTGSKKVSRGNLFGKKTRVYDASVEGNVADMLRQAGYDVSAETPEAARSLLSDRDLLTRFLDATSTSKSSGGGKGFSTLEGAGAGASTGASIGSIVPGVGTAAGAAIGATIGGAVGANTLDPVQATSDLYKELEEKLGIKGIGAVGQGVQDVRGVVGDPLKDLGNRFGSNVIGDVFRGIGGVVGGIDTGAMKAYGESVAKDIAIQDLRNKYANWLASQGFENRANIADTETTRARTAALQELLKRQS